MKYYRVGFLSDFIFRHFALWLGILLIATSTVVNNYTMQLCFDSFENAIYNQHHDLYEDQFVTIDSRKITDWVVNEVHGNVGEYSYKLKYYAFEKGPSQKNIFMERNDEQESLYVIIDIIRLSGFVLIVLNFMLSAFKKSFGIRYWSEFRPSTYKK